MMKPNRREYIQGILAAMATAAVPAELFHLSQREGKVMPGMRGDLTILSEDPASGNPEAFTKPDIRSVAAR
jgi:N-acetylglucosamine-6-phosphate deacetylase